VLLCSSIVAISETAWNISHIPSRGIGIPVQK
jgi:hypothetical protein